MMNRRNFLSVASATVGGIILGNFTPKYKEEEPIDPDLFQYGLDGIDEALNGGFRRGSLNMVMGLTSSGKSCVLVQSALRNAKQGKKVLYVTYEDHSAIRRLAMWGRTPIITAQQHKCDHEQCYITPRHPNLMVVKSSCADLDDFWSEYLKLTAIRFHQDGSWKPDLVILDDLLSLPFSKAAHSTSRGYYRNIISRMLVQDVMQRDYSVLLSMQLQRAPMCEDRVAYMCEDQEAIAAWSFAPLYFACTAVSLKNCYKETAIKALLIKNRYGPNRVGYKYLVCPYGLTLVSGGLIV